MGAFPPKRYTDWKKHVAMFGMSQPEAATWDANAPEFSLVVSFFLPTKQMTDVDNLVGGILDGFNKVLWCDDSRVRFCLATKDIAREPERACAVITVLQQRLLFTELDHPAIRKHRGEAILVPTR
jgi:Holliday junction resolvase RusA-like endonuclease